MTTIMELQIRKYVREGFDLHGIRISGIWISSCKSSSIPLTIKCSIRVILGSILAHSIRFALTHPELKALALNWLCRYPALESRLYRFSAARGIIAGGVIVQNYSDLSRLTPSALAIYADLKKALERHEDG